MTVVLRLLALFVFVPLVELWLLLVLARHTSVAATLLLVVVTGVVGTVLAREQGWRTIRTIQRELAQGHLPTDALLDAAMILMAGAMLLTPGMITDAIGLTLLLPPCRRFWRRQAARWLRRHFTLHMSPVADQPASSRVIDAQVVRRSEDPPPRGDGDSMSGL